MRAWRVGTADNIPAGLRDSSTNDQAGGKQCEKKHWYILQPCSKAHIHSLSHSCRLYDVVTSRQKADLKIVINLSIRTLPSTFQASEIIDDKQSLNTIDLWPFFWFILVVRMVNISISRKFQSQNQDLKPRSQVANMTPVEMRSTKRDLEFNEISERSTLEKKSHVKPKRPRNSIQSNHPFSGDEFLQLTRLPLFRCRKIFRVPIKTRWEKVVPSQKSFGNSSGPSWLKNCFYWFSDPPILLWLLLQGHWPHESKHANFTKMSKIPDIIWNLFGVSKHANL